MNCGLFVFLVAFWFGFFRPLFKQVSVMKIISLLGQSAK